MERQATQGTTFAAIASEALVLAGGARALLLQIAHPAIGRGVVEHSDFEQRVMGRFHATMTFVYASAFGTDAEYAAVRRQVNRAHVPVRAAQTGAEPAYNAFDPHLQLWVAATLFQTMMDVYQRVFGAFSDAEKEQVYREFVTINRFLQIPPEAWPETEADFEAYWNASIRELRVTDATRRVAGQILYPKNVPLWLRATLPDARLVTAGLLPPSIRQQFGMHWEERSRRRFERRMRWTKRVYPKLPARLRHGPREGYLRRLRAVLRAEDGTPS